MNKEHCYYTNILYNLFYCVFLIKFCFDKILRGNFDHSSISRGVNGSDIIRFRPDPNPYPYPRLSVSVSEKL